VSVEVSAIIVSYNTRAMTLRCLESLGQALDGIASEVFVVDNASKDGSADAIRERFPNVKVVENPVNAGFGAANNLAMREASGDFVLLINSDAFARPGAVKAMLAVMRGDDRIGVVGPRLLNEDASLQRSVYRYPSPAQAVLENLWLSRLLGRAGLREDYEAWPHDQQADVPWVIGACMLVRRRVIDEVGGFDERFFMYAEEADWQKRIADGGWRIVFTPAAEVMHLGGASGAKEPAKISGHFFNSLDRYEYKHHGLSGLVVLRGAMVLGSCLRLPMWAMAWLLRPERRAVAASKMKLHGWLARRQLTAWRGVSSGSVG
jgi:GT2 family glycosyltransferase